MVSTRDFDAASMKALPKRKGNCSVRRVNRRAMLRLNESPSKKEGKLVANPLHLQSLP